MNTQLTIKNFRVFDENGVAIDIKPMTILTGCNSSGKSSIVKAAFLLNTFMKQVNNAIENGEKIELNKYKLDFTGYPNNLLGRFDKVIPNGSTSQKVTLGYTVHSCLLSKDVDVQLVFAADKNDDLNNAYLISISMSTDEGVFYSSDKENGSVFNLNMIKDSLLTFAPIDFLLSQFCITYNLPDLTEFGFEEDHTDDELEGLVSQLREKGKERVMEVVKYNRFKKNNKENDYNEEQLSILEWTEKNKSFFNIPVLDYLRTVSKKDIMTVVNNELISDDQRNAYLVSETAVLAASHKVVNDFLASKFDSFDVYFTDCEHRHFEKVVISNEAYSPCFSSISLQQDFTRSYPGSGWSSCDLLWDDDEEIKRNVKKEKTPQQKLKEWEETPLTFDNLYEVVMLWNEKFTSEKSAFYNGGVGEVEIFKGQKELAPCNFNHHAFDMLTSFAEKVIHEVVLATGFENMSYVSSSRATVKKLYAMDEKNDFTELLKRYFESKRLFEEREKYKKPDYSVNDFMNRWIKQFGLGHALSFQLDEEGLGVKIRLYKSTEDNCGRLLSDEGYGITQLISILLQIETAILSAKEEKANKKSIDGLSCFDKYDKVNFHFEENTIAIEEPEIHLHPNYQSKLAEMFAEAYNKYNIHFIIETHSEYLIRKFQTFVAHGQVGSDTISLNYIFSTGDYVSPSDSRVKHIPINKDGSLADSFGSGFFDEADNLSVELMSIKM